MKRKDSLEEFIRTNRDAFDDKDAPVAVWDRISRSLSPGKTATGIWNNLVVWKAAAVIFMAVSIYLAIPKNAVPENSDTLALNEFKDVEAFYFSEISEKVELIESLSGETGADDLTQDFKQLEAMYLVLKEELKTRPSKKVKDALVLNLLVRINLLNQQLQRLEEEYKEEEQGQET